MISPPSSQRLSTWRRIVFGERLDDTKCSMKGRKQISSCSPGGRSLSKPIQERGQLSRSRQEGEPSGGASDAVVRFILEVFGFPSIDAMELSTILNHSSAQPGFVYGKARFSSDQKSIEVALRPRMGSKGICAQCEQPAPGYDQLPERRFEFIPFWGFLVFFLYCRRRVQCRGCGVVAEKLPGSDGKHQSTKAQLLFLAHWARKLSWQETAQAFRTSWDRVHDAVQYVVDGGLKNRTLESIYAIGGDEIQYSKGQQYLTLVYLLKEDFQQFWTYNSPHAQPDRADEEGRPHTAQSPGVITELLPGQKAVLQRCN